MKILKSGEDVNRQRKENAGLKLDRQVGLIPLSLAVKKVFRKFLRIYFQTRYD